MRFHTPETALKSGYGYADSAVVVDRIVDELTLRDGEQMVIRPIRPQDAGKLAGLHARLSPNSVYRRYFGFKPSLNAAEIQRFTDIAEDWRFALVGVRNNGQLTGVTRYEGRAGRVDAEIALIVDDALQHHGLGRALLMRLIDVARVRGMASLTAIVLASNTPMLRLLGSLPVPSAFGRDGGDVVVTLDLADLELPANRSDIANAHVAEASAIRAVQGS